MRVNFKKSTLRSLFLIAGVSFALSGCSLKKDNNEEELEQLVEYYKDELDKIKNDINNNQEDYDDNEQIESTDKPVENITISNVSDLEQYFEDEVSFQDLRRVIRENMNLSNKDKKRILKIIDKLEEKTPFIDLRCLYENIKLLSMERGKNPDSDSNAVASFSYSEHKINLFEDNDHYLTHEFIHMIIMLFLNIDDKNIIIDRPFSTEDIDFILEGFTEWFTKYLFDYNKYSYYTQVNDIEIIKYILDLSDEELIEKITDNDASYITKSSKDYLSKDEINDWISISKKELESIKYKSKENITSSEMVRKYTILLKACINAKEIIGSSEKYQIMELLSNSFSYYSDIYEDEVEILKNSIESTLNDILDYTNNDIEIIGVNGVKKEYCDIDQLYLIKVDDEFFIAEEYFDSNGKEKYYANVAYEADIDDIIVPISSLIEYDGEQYSSYTINDLMQIYSDYAEEYDIDTGKGSYQKTYE